MVRALETSVWFLTWRQAGRPREGWGGPFQMFRAIGPIAQSIIQAATDSTSALRRWIGIESNGNSGSTTRNRCDDTPVPSTNAGGPSLVVDQC